MLPSHETAIVVLVLGTTRGSRPRSWDRCTASARPYRRKNVAAIR